MSVVVVFLEPKTPLKPAKMFRFREADAVAFEPVSCSCVAEVVWVVDWDWDWDWASRWAIRRVIFEVGFVVVDFGVLFRGLIWAIL